MDEILPLLWSKRIARFIAEIRFVLLTIALAEVGTDGTLAAMPKGRVAEVVGQAGCADDTAHLCEVSVLEMGVTFQKLATDIVAQTAPYATDFKRVGEAVMYENAAWQREDLSLVLQAAECCGKDKTVEVALEFRAIVFAVGRFLLPQTLIR